MSFEENNSNRNKNNLELGNKPSQDFAKIGLTRGQLFVRIPTVISTQLNLSPSDYLGFSIEEINNKKIIIVQVVPK